MMTPELWWSIGSALAVQLIGYGAVRQQVKDLADAMREEKLERQRIDERVRALEISGGRKSFVKTTG